MVSVVVGCSICEATGVEELLTRSLWWLEAKQVVWDFTSVVRFLLFSPWIKVWVGVRVEQEAFELRANWWLQRINCVADLIAWRNDWGKCVLRRWRFNQHLVIVLRYWNVDSWKRAIVLIEMIGKIFAEWAHLSQASCFHRLCQSRSEPRRYHERLGEATSCLGQAWKESQRLRVIVPDRFERFLLRSCCAIEVSRFQIAFQCQSCSDDRPSQTLVQSSK